MKKIKLNIAKYAIILGLATVPMITNSCRQELDINVDPNNPADATVQGLLSGAQAGFAYALGGNGSRMPGSVVQHYAGHRNQPLDYAQYNITSSATERTWVEFYRILGSLKRAEEKAVESGDKIYEGMTKILQAHVFSVLTDLYGDIPFTDALQGRANITPAYDKQENIYPELVKLLEEGITLVKSGTGGVRASTSDIMYRGDFSKWEKYANSLKLRLLNHQSKRNAGLAAAFLATNPPLIDVYTENAQVNFGSSAANSNPIYQFDNLSGRKDQAVASTLVDKMVGLSDPRVPVYFTPIKNGANAGQIVGNAPGGDDDDAGETKYSRVGSAYASNTSPVVFITAAEVHFIKAEVYSRAGNHTNAKAAYDQAITEDFKALGLASSVVGYLANTNVAYNNTLQRVMEQKWITMFQAPYESWVDWRRTGFPALTPSSDNYTNNVIPRRLPYPSVEINSNRANLIAGPGIPVPYVTLLTSVWWDQ